MRVQRQARVLDTYPHIMVVTELQYHELDVLKWNEVGLAQMQSSEGFTSHLVSG